MIRLHPTPSRILVAVALLAAAATSPSLLAGPIVGMSLQALPNLGLGTASATAVNEAGSVVGFYTTSVSTQAFKYVGGVITGLGTLGTGATSAGYGINAQNTVVGYSNILPIPSTVQHAFQYTSGPMVDLNPLGASSSQAFGINNAGQVVGSRFQSGQRAFIEQNGTYTILGTLGGTISRGRAISENGQVTGESSISNGQLRAFLYNGTTMQNLGTLGGTASTGRGVNDLGQVSGSASTTSGQTHGFVYSGGVMTDVGTFGGTSSSGYAINNYSQAVGMATTGDNKQHAYVYSEGTLYNLESIFSSFLVSGTAVGFRSLTIAEDISDSGWIVGTGRYYTGTAEVGRAFLARIEPPATTAVPDRTPVAALLGLAALGLLGERARRRSVPVVVQR